MKLVNSYCYSDINTAADTLASDPFIGDGRVLKSYSVLDADTVSLIYKKNSNLRTYIVTPPNCTREGFNNTYFGVSVADSVEVWAGSAIILVSVFVIKILKRGA